MASWSDGTSAGRRPLVIVLAVIGVIAIVVGVLYLVAGNSLPSFLTAGSHVHKGNHDERGAAALIVGVAAFIGAWISSKGRRR